MKGKAARTCTNATTFPHRVRISVTVGGDGRGMTHAPLLSGLTAAALSLGLVAIACAPAQGQVRDAVPESLSVMPAVHSQTEVAELDLAALDGPAWTDTGNGVSSRLAATGALTRDCEDALERAAGEMFESEADRRDAVRACWASPPVDS